MPAICTENSRTWRAFEVNVLSSEFRVCMIIDFRFSLMNFHFPSFIYPPFALSLVPCRSISFSLLSRHFFTFNSVIVFICWLHKIWTLLCDIDFSLEIVTNFMLLPHFHRVFAILQTTIDVINNFFYRNWLNFRIRSFFVGIYW